jgi:two-component system chemotaxis response regulator CheY
MSFNGVILLVDDEPHIRKYVSLILQQLGRPTIHEAGNGEDAVAAYQREQPDLVLLDVSMPRMDGIETLRALKAIDPACAVVMLTSMVNRETIEQAAEAGALNYIRKDIPRAEITKALAETIAENFETG